MIHFVGAGSGAKDLITVRGMRLLQSADVIIYAGSLVNPELLEYKKEGCEVFNSALMTLEEVAEIMLSAKDKEVVRLHTGDPSVYGAIREQMDILEKEGAKYDICPGVSSFCAAAASLGMEYTLPGISQSLIITRMEGRTPVPEREKLRAMAAHQSSMAIFLSAGMAEEVSAELIAGGYPPETPAAIVYKASWPDEEKYICDIASLPECAREHGINKTALIITGEAVAQRNYSRSKLYDPEFETGFRKAKKL
ncbi:MAG: precorrin-4 C(11)-methyltransferase [Firmicutes bacterium]|nr:precorrin-4 C(11)-methyltransferase [Bacillota bacterium]